MFADNNRITHRQLFCQVILAIAGPLLLFVPGIPLLEGISGVLLCLLVWLLVCGFLFWMVRMSFAFGHPHKYLGKTGAWVIGGFWIVYFVVTGAFCLHLTVNVASYYLVPDLSPQLLLPVALIGCLGAGVPSIQKRGRMAGICFWPVAILLVVLLTVAVVQQPLQYLKPLGEVAGGVGMWVDSGYLLLSLFMGMGALPFILGQVKGSGSAVKSLVWAATSVLGYLALALLFLQGALGSEQIGQRAYPLVTFIAGVRLPGDLSVRFDPLWIALLLFVTLFSVGSCLFYGHTIGQRVYGKFTGWCLAIPMYLLANVFGQWSNPDYFYIKLLEGIFFPLMLISYVLISICYRRRRG